MSEHLFEILSKEIPARLHAAAAADLRGDLLAALQRPIAATARAADFSRLEG